MFKKKLLLALPSAPPEGKQPIRARRSLKHSVVLAAWPPSPTHALIQSSSISSACSFRRSFENKIDCTSFANNNLLYKMYDHIYTELQAHYVRCRGAISTSGKEA